MIFGNRAFNQGRRVLIASGMVFLMVCIVGCWRKRLGEAEREAVARVELEKYCARKKLNPADFQLSSFRPNEEIGQQFFFSASEKKEMIIVYVDEFGGSEVHSDKLE